MQPDVHLGAAVLAPVIAELGRKLLAVVEARIDVEQLHQIDDRAALVQVGIAFLLRDPAKHLFDIDLLRLGLQLRSGLAGNGAGHLRLRSRRGLAWVAALACPKMASLILPKMLINNLLMFYSASHRPRNLPAAPIRSRNMSPEPDACGCAAAARVAGRSGAAAEHAPEAARRCPACFIT